ncbi:MAG TPA: RIO1 family regulatory kinase/ATPase [Actinomycetota bacterium]|nr:RIO1 family regulatory kinase/ATPase [Actinomycetota bacterium]
MDTDRLMDDEAEATSFDHFLGEGLVTDVVRIIKTGKEASVHLCRANRSTTGEDLLALKVYHPLDRRDFRDESIYRDGEWIKERRIRVALEKKTRFGREVQGAIWVDREWETLKALSAAGAPVPRPLAATGDAILMTYVGDADRPAPQLRSVRPSREEAQDLFRQVMRALELLLFRNVIHGDLSAYNVLVWDGRAVVIDLPQAVDPRKNRHAEAMLQRDVARVCEHFARHGVSSSPEQITSDLWNGWRFADLVPEELRVELEI